MGSLQSIFFRPARGYRKYEELTQLTSVAGSTRLGENTRTVGNTLYQLDGIISEQHTSVAKVTKHPVEYGVDISDYVIKQPMKIVVNGIVTNSPFIKQMSNRLPGDANFATQALETLKGERARNAFKGLIELQNERQPVRLQTGLLVYDNMILSSVSAPNDLQDNLRVKLTFEEIFVADGFTTGAIQAVTTTPTEADFVTAGIALAGLGIAGLSLL
jgi:hypothetical protein